MGEAREVMDRVTETVFKNDQDALKALYAPDAVAETPDQGTLNGADAIAAYLGEFLVAFPDASYESVHTHESGANAIDEGFFVGTHTGPMTGPDGETIEGTGKSARLRVCDVTTVEGGVVTSHRFYFDNMEFMQQLGLVPESVSG
jgi:ketosteroid isomerase-like protein